ncbi:Rpn family recombination-promoting nuclease/putative transposase [Clostridium aestuarii]|uniref:Rpn family recombination-promoting nuclease/putative transposase n=1 Tax=Clostridium aestuarii TaxID=338193 RepID=A0ABT4D2X4_9CLOT|nr:Rpn family recombination-promoting nuclease/putative transposase [Clostridium aestuarii]MCY6485487.1 Rpn family recombination-promoting nuclease/putative transposase [Clostridium aestuarii]
MGDEINNEHDLGYKSILSNKKNFIEFMRSFVKKDWVDVINEDNIVLIDKEFILEDFKEEEADLIYKANIEGRDIIFYVLLELQSKVDFRMPIRLLMYMTEIWRDELNNTENNLKKKKEYKLPAIIPIVLYNGKNNWTAVRNFKEILSGHELFEDNVVDFRYLLFDVNRMDKNELIDIANVISSVFLLDQKVEIEELVNRLKLVGKFIKSKASKEQEKVFKGWILNILKKRLEDENKEDIAKVLIQISEKEGDDMISNLGDTIIKGLEEREKIGIEKGIEKIAVNMLKRGDSIEDIIEITELSYERIVDIKNKLLN